eukprot:NODE_673_length_5339_cov_0.242366.p1 type:complete len:370 gc:universal NODE_673_length_5339_cov_0.242366:3150-4259(+)
MMGKCNHVDCTRMASQNVDYCGSHIPHHYESHSKFKCELCDTFITISKIKKHKFVCPCRPKVLDYVVKNANLIAKDPINSIEIDLPDLFCLFEDEVPTLPAFDVNLNSKLFKSNIQEYILSRILKKYVDEANLESFGVIDFGSGKAEFLHHIRMSFKDFQNITYIAVDKRSFKFKFDRKFKFNNLKQEACELESCKFKRLHCDLQDLCIDNVLELNGMDLVGTCKHLCGSATDLGINCLIKQKSKLFLFAPCCHHRISNMLLYDPLDLPFHKLERFRLQFGKKYKLSANPNEMFGQILASIAKLSSWATIKSNPESAERIRIGRRAKFFFDELRGKYCERKGYDVVHAIYCSESITPENRIMVCVAKLI